MVLLRAYNFKGEPFDFSLKDCPIYVSNKVLALSKIEGSGLFREDTIIRGDSDSGYFEGDEVWSGDKFVGYVVYSKGFVVQTQEGELKTLEDIEHIKVKQGNQQTAEFVNKLAERTEILMYYDERWASLKSIVCPDKKKIVLSNGKFDNEAISPDALDFITGFVDEDGKDIVFNRSYKGGIVKLYNGLPALRRNGEYIYLKSI